MQKKPVRPPIDELDIDYFRWWVPDNGFAWQRLYRVEPGGARSTGELDTVLVLRPGKWAKCYQPLEEQPGLFLEFASLGIDALQRIKPPEELKRAIERFAGSYGDLGGMEEFFRSKSIKPTARWATPNLPKRKTYFGDSWWTWVYNIFMMRQAVSVWELTGASKSDKKPELAGLRERIVWKQDGSETEVGVRHPEDRGWTLIAASDHPRSSELLKGWRVGELLGPAWAFVANQINKGMRGRTSPQFVYRDGKWQPATVPHDLLGCLWYQFFRAFTGEARIRRCSAPDCGKWMLYERDSKIMHKRCANRTRQRRHREKTESKQ